MLGLYVHLPFCRQHCTYCPFVISTDLSLQDRYVDALCDEIASRGNGEEVDTIYFGGGTPSRTSAANLARVVAAIENTFQCGGGRPRPREGERRAGTPATTLGTSEPVEFSIEANPEDVDAQSLEQWRALGVNRISIGVQSFHDDELAPLGRLHGRAGAIDAVKRAIASGMRTNLDLILGLPQQTAESFQETLDIAIDLGVGHLSLYMLDLDEKTPLQTLVARGRTTLPEDDIVAITYIASVEQLERAGLHQYEVSNFARAGEECQHNLRYWQRREYHGFGVGAHSFIGARRFANTRDIHRYVAREFAPDFAEDLTAADIKREHLLLGLRQKSGLDYALIEGLCGTEGTAWIERGVHEGWLRREGSRIAFTPSGFLLSNDYISQLF